MTDAAEKSSTKKASSRTGIVSSVSGAKTIRVVVDSLVRHPTYGKYVRHRTKLAVHDPKGQAAVGDMVEIVPCRRISKDKSWRLLRVVRKGAVRIETSAEDKG
jgi:small subunit ribosomal protein S17